MVLSEIGERVKTIEGENGKSPKNGLASGGEALIDATPEIDCPLFACNLNM